MEQTKDWMKEPAENKREVVIAVHPVDSPLTLIETGSRQLTNFSNLAISRTFWRTPPHHKSQGIPLRDMIERMILPRATGTVEQRGNGTKKIKI